MIQALGLLLAGAAAAGLILADSVLLVLACWALGAVLYAGLSALGRSAVTARAARRGFIVEMIGAWALALGGLSLVLAAGTGDLDLLPAHLLLLDLGRSALPWAGLGVLLAVLCRLGVPPAPPWPAGVAAAPPSVRIFLHAGLHPLTALILWHRLDVWLLPWHRELALWLGALGALLLVLAAAGERHGGRRAAYLGVSRWAALLAVASHETLPGWAPWLLAVGLALIQLAVATPRWPRRTRRILLAVGGLAALPAGVPAGMLTLAGPWLNRSPQSLLLHAATLLMLRVLWTWWEDLRRPLVLPDPASRRTSSLPILADLARWGRGGDLTPGPATAMVRGLARITADIDRLILDGILEGIGWITLGAGWAVAWLDRRGLDALDHGLDTFTGAVGRACARSAGARPGVVLLWSILIVLAFTLLGRTLA